MVGLYVKDIYSFRNEDKAHLLEKFLLKEFENVAE